VSTSTSQAHCIKKKKRESIRWLFEGEINRMHIGIERTKEKK
jgi:hypothetical protein